MFLPVQNEIHNPKACDMKLIDLVAIEVLRAKLPDYLNTPENPHDDRAETRLAEDCYEIAYAMLSQSACN